MAGSVRATAVQSDEQTIEFIPFLKDNIHPKPGLA